MNINGLYNELKKIDDSKLSRCIKLYLVKKQTEGTNIILYNLEVESEVQIDLLNIFKVYFQNSRTRNREQLEYDVVMDHTDKSKFLVIESNKYNGIENFIELFEDPSPADTIKGIDVGEFIAYAVHVCIPDELNFSFVGEFTSLSKVSKMKVVGNLKNNKFNKLDTSDTFGFSKNIAMVIYDDEVLIKHLPIFEKCCQMETEFKKNSAEVLNSIASFKFIDNIEELLHTAEKDTRIARRLTKMNSDPDRVKAFFTNKDRVKLVLKDPEFNDKFKGIEYNGSTLVYDSKLRQQFITLISDAAYESIVGGQKRIDNSL